jgi:hypothetical protein
MKKQTKKILFLSFLLFGAITIMKFYPLIFKNDSSEMRSRDQALALIKKEGQVANIDVTKDGYFLIGSFQESSTANPHSKIKPIDLLVYTNLPKGYPYKLSIHRKLVRRELREGEDVSATLPIAADFIDNSATAARSVDFVIGKNIGRIDESGEISGVILPMNYAVQTLLQFDKNVLKDYRVSDPKYLLVMVSGDHSRLQEKDFPFVSFEFQVGSDLVIPIVSPNNKERK